MKRTRTHATVITALATVAVTAQPASAQQSNLCVDGLPGRTLIVGTPGDDVLVGTPGEDIICGFGGNDRIFGLAGSDRIEGGAGNDIMYGGDDLDVFEDVTGSNTVHGGGGRDAVTLGGGNDIVYGQGDGVGRVRTGDGDDIIWTGPGTYDIVDAGAGNDEIYLNATQRQGNGSGPILAVVSPTSVTVRAGAGNDTVQLLSATPEDGLIIDLGDGTDKLLGTDGPDRIILLDSNERDGNSDRFIPSTILLFGGDDYFVGDLGPEIVYGGPGDDLLIGDPIAVEYNGPKGEPINVGENIANDLLVGGSGNDTLYGQGGNDRLVGQKGQDAMFGDNFPENVYGDANTPFTPFIYAGSMNDSIYGANDGAYDYIDAGVGLDYCKADDIDDARRCEFPN